MDWRTIFKTIRDEATTLSQAEAARLIGYNQGNYSGFENANGDKTLGDKKLRQLANMLGLDGDLAVVLKRRKQIPDDEAQQIIKQAKARLRGELVGEPVGDDVVEIPVLNARVAAGHGLCVADLDQEIDRYEALPAKLVKNPRDCVFFEVEGDSMEPRLFEGDLVLVDCTASPKTGSLVVAQVDGLLMVKLLKARGGKWQLHSYNADYDTVAVAKGFEYVWRVIKVWGNG